MGPLLDSPRSPASWQPGDQEAIRQALGLPATVLCLDAIVRAMADLERQHPAGVLSARALLDAVALIDQQLLAAGPEQEQAIQRTSRSGPIAGSVAADGDAPLQKADVIAYDTALLREERETTYANPASTSMGLLAKRRRSNNLEKELRGLRQQLTRFSEINPEEYARLQEADRQKQLLEQQLELWERQMEEAAAKWVAAVSSEGMPPMNGCRNCARSGCWSAPSQK